MRMPRGHSRREGDGSSRNQAKAEPDRPAPETAAAAAVSNHFALSDDEDRCPRFVDRVAVVAGALPLTGS